MDANAIFLEKKFNAQYVGILKGKYVFFQAKPDIGKGHTNYFQVELKKNTQEMMAIVTSDATPYINALIATTGGW